jgi:hypothetical protein
MKLDSVREAKADALRILSRQLTPVVASRLSVAARSIDKVSEPRRLVAVGIARSGRQFRLAIRVQERALLDSPFVNAAVQAARGEVDVAYVGRIGKSVTPAWLQQRRRPLQIGLSVGHFKVTAGTLGCFVRKPGSDAIGLLSNNHVLANENSAKKGDAVIQPGSYDGGKKSKDTVAQLESFVRVKKTATNFVDCAWALLNDGVDAKLDALQSVGSLSSPTPVQPEIDMPVLKLGRTTGLTRGVVTAVEVDQLIVGFDMGNCQFDDQIEIQPTANAPFSLGGDSGSMILTESLEPVALLFAGSDSGGKTGYGITYANPMATVLSNLNVEIAV